MANQDINVNVTVNPQSSQCATHSAENAPPQESSLPIKDTLAVLLDKQRAAAVPDGIPTATFSTEDGDQLVVYFFKEGFVANGHLEGQIMPIAELKCSGSGKVEAPEDARILSVITGLQLQNVQFATNNTGIEISNLGTLDVEAPNPITELCKKIGSEKAK